MKPLRVALRAEIGLALQSFTFSHTYSWAGKAIAPLGENVLLLKMLLASNEIVVLEKQQNICDPESIEEHFIPY